MRAAQNRDFRQGKYASCETVSPTRNGPLHDLAETNEPSQLIGKLALHHLLSDLGLRNLLLGARVLPLQCAALRMAHSATSISPGAGWSR